jgi:hypothetical protein
MLLIHKECLSGSSLELAVEVRLNRKIFGIVKIKP